MAKQITIIGKYVGGKIVFDVPVEREKLAMVEDGSVVEVRPYRTPSHEQYKLVQWVCQTASDATGIPAEEIKTKAKAAAGYFDGPGIIMGEQLFQPLKSTSAMSRKELSAFIEDLIDFCAAELLIDVGALRREVQSRMAMRR